MDINTSNNCKPCILVPIDYSGYSLLACRFAALIAKRSNSTLLLFHAFYSPAFDLIELSGGVQTQKQLKQDVTKKLLENEEEEIAKFITGIFKQPELQGLSNEDIQYKLEAGLAKDEILKIADTIQPWMVVMGTHGVNNKTNSLLGSITEVAIKKLKVPVLAIPENYQFTGDDSIDRILYLTEFDESDFLSIKKLMNFSTLFNMTIHCVHVGSKDEQWDYVKMEGLKDYFKMAYNERKVECKAISGKHELVHAIDEYSNSNKINIISLTHHKRRLIDKLLKPGITTKLFYNSKLPLLVFHS